MVNVQRLEECEGCVSVLEERGREREGEVRRARELLRMEREERSKETVAHSQVTAGPGQSPLVHMSLGWFVPTEPVLMKSTKVQALGELRMRDTAN